jgi:Fur family peroxide stress response transcriptional regulator
MRYSMQREMILNTLKESADHPNAETVYQRVQKKAPHISLGTVYRNLNQLCEAKEIISIETDDSSVHYDGNPVPHRHFVCTRCGKIVDLFIQKEFPDELSEMGLIVEAEKCIYYGVCNKCK